MKIFNLGDIHIRSENPRNRTDKFCDTLFEKLEWGFNLAKEKKCKYIAIPGDLFHSSRANNYVIGRIIELFKKYDIKAIGVAGNHDLFFHTSCLDNTPLNVLMSANVLTMLGENPLIDSNTHLYGANWKQPIPEIKDKNAVNILLIHKMIINEDKLWEAQKEYTTAKSLLGKNNFDLIISGDNHSSFFVEHNGKKLINCGSLTRSTSAQLNHKPICGIYNTDVKELEIFEVPIRPISEVFSLEEIEEIKQSKEDNTKIKEYVKLLEEQSDKKVEWNYVSNLDSYFKEAGVSQEVLDIVYSTLEE